MSRGSPSHPPLRSHAAHGHDARHGVLLLRFAGAGAFGTLAHYAVLLVLVNAAAVDAWWASVAGSVLGAHVNYLINYHWTYRQVVGHARSYPRFMLVALLGMVINAACMHLFVRELGLHYLLSQFVSTAVVFVVGFVLNTIWTFRRQR